MLFAEFVTLWSVSALHHLVSAINPYRNPYQGNDSSDEEDLLDVPDDDQYDTEDSFIDDAELVGVFVDCFGLFMLLFGFDC